MKAIWNGSTIAEAAKEDLVRIEGNWYFPPESINKEYFSDSDHKTTCFWKGESSYYDINVDGETNEFGAFFYADPMDGAAEKVKHDFKDYIAFWNGVEVKE